ncbi:MAG: LysM peptidoglycan-binding domain-containing protein [Bacteroidales bacterium]|nr:LysM peptidoglycan-binding domain-containing protein [Bacteroidales bacterium]
MSAPIWAEKRTYEVKPGDTLYRISHMFQVTQEAIQKANPGIINGLNVPAGAVIVIPEPDMEEVSALASPITSSQSNSTVASAVSVTPSAQQIEQQIEHLFAPERKLDGTKSIAIILPFNLASRSAAEDKVQMRSVEFYQGALLAINKAQLRGMRIDLHTFDLATETLEHILTRPELSSMDLIIAPMEPADIRQVALFGESHGINVLNPFKLVPDLTATCPHLFQMNTYTAELYPELSDEIKTRFPEYAIVFVTDSMYRAKKDPYAAYLKKYLKECFIDYREYTYNSPGSVSKMDAALGLENSNVLYIPETPQRDAMRRFFPSFKNKLFLDKNPEAEFADLQETNPEKYAAMLKELEEERKQRKTDVGNEERKIAILGYPEWQLYTNDFMDYFFDMNVWMFSKFYVDPFDPEVIDVQGKYRYWYAREMMELYPKYGLLGYDVLSYGLHMLNTYGHDFDLAADGKMIKTLQSAMLFRREGNGGFINKGFYLVHFTPESKIQRYEIK